MTQKSGADNLSRVTPELPGNIQNNLASLELEAAPLNRLSGLQSPAPLQDANGYPLRRDSALSTLTALNSPTALQHTPLDEPSFSPFPPLRKRPVNVPPSDEEREGILEKARVAVLNSNDPDMQLTWAQDTLTFVEIAAQNEARIAENQGARPQTPHTEHQLRVDAISIVQFLADQHHPKAEFLKGMWLEFGKFGCRIDKKEAFRCYQRAAQKGYARAEYRMAMQFETSNEPDKALKHYALGVQQGDSASHYRLGMISLLGQHGQPLDYDKGIKFVSYAAETADENAPQGAYVFGMLQARELPQINLPEQYLPLNISGARFNIEKAAYLGFAKAQAKMGAAYELCQLGCDFEPALSLHYNALAARQGDADAEMAISKWFLCGYDGVFEKNEGLAFTYAQRAAQSGLATAEFAMGYFYEVGIYVQVDHGAARSWYEKAADHGNKDAAARVDGIARSKTLSRRDHDNIAVAKIKSQHGSHRGKRPDRFRNPSAPMPTMHENYNPINMPEPNLPQPRPGEYRPSPYPPTSGPPGRPVSVAPYPLDDSSGRQGLPPPRPSTQPQRANQNLRPQIQIPTSPVESETSFGDNNYRGSAFPTFKPQPQPQGQSYPPSPSTGGTGRGGPSQSYPSQISPHQHAPPQRFPPHNGPPQNFPPPNMPGAQGPGYRKGSAGGYSSPLNPSPARSPAMTPQRPQTAQPPAIDIGFSAPPDLSGADKPRRLQKPVGNHNNTTLPGAAQPRKSSHDLSIGRPLGSLPSSPHSPHPSAMPIQGRRTESPSRKPVIAARPGPSQHTQSSIASHGVTLHDGPLAAPSRPNPDRSSNTPPPTVPATKPPGKGPKTFQEMGVPLQKKEEDCVSRLANLHSVNMLIHLRSLCNSYHIYLSCQRIA